jgi:hypothetical protein
MMGREDLTPKELRRLNRLRKQLRGKPSAATEELLTLVARNMEGDHGRERMERDRTIIPAQVKFYHALVLVASENEDKP